MTVPEHLDSMEVDGSDATLMTFWGHIEDLRKRLFIALLALGAATAGSFAFAEKVIILLAKPVGSISSLQSIEVTENVAVFMRVALLCGVTIAMPIILYELMAFILPGLKRGEKRWLYTTIFFGTLLFLAGAVFAYFIMLPTSVTFLINFLAVETKPRLSSYINFITSLIFWLGVGFQFPIIIFALAKLNILSAKTLAKGWRYSLVIIAIMAAIITPTVDPVNMVLLMAPLFVLYLLSVLFAFIATGRTKQDQPSENGKDMQV